MGEIDEIDACENIPPEVIIANENRRGKLLLRFALEHVEKHNKRLAHKIKKHLGIAFAGITK